MWARCPGGDPLYSWKPVHAVSWRTELLLHVKRSIDEKQLYCRMVNGLGGCTAKIVWDVRHNGHGSELGPFPYSTVEWFSTQVLLGCILVTMRHCFASLHLDDLLLMS